MTEYRVGMRYSDKQKEGLIHESNSMRSEYLQFKSTVKKRRFYGKVYEKEVWRFIPTLSSSDNVCLEESDCPYKFVRGFSFCSIWEIDSEEINFLKGTVEFVEKYPDIQEYFDYLSRRALKKRLEEVLK